MHKIAQRHVEGEVSMEVLEKNIKDEFGIDMGGKMAKLQAPMNEYKLPQLPALAPTLVSLIAHLDCGTSQIQGSVRGCHHRHQG